MNDVMYLPGDGIDGANGWLIICPARMVLTAAANAIFFFPCY